MVIVIYLGRAVDALFTNNNEGVSVDLIVSLEGEGRC